MSRDNDNHESNTSSNETLAEVAARRLSRRSILRGGLGALGLMTGGAALLAACGDDAIDIGPNPDSGTTVNDGRPINDSGEEPVDGGHGVLEGFEGQGLGPVHGGQRVHCVHH